MDNQEPEKQRPMARALIPPALPDELTRLMMEASREVTLRTGLAAPMSQEAQVRQMVQANLTAELEARLTARRSAPAPTSTTEESRPLMDYQALISAWLESREESPFMKMLELERLHKVSPPPREIVFPRGKPLPGPLQRIPLPRLPSTR